MGTVLTYQQTSIDTSRTIRFDRPLYATFFNAESYLDGSTRVTDLSEQQIVRWMLLCGPARRLIFNQLGL